MTVITVLAVGAGSIGEADAAKRRKPSWQASKYAAIVIDANTDKVLFAEKSESARYPASLTKMMTLYVLFDDLAAGKLTKASKISASARSAAQPPSKLGLKPGQTISVDQAIRALVTKSANDVAVAIAEHVAGSESAFAERMTQTARRLGMNDTTFRNASGLPDSGQRTTAKDLSILARALLRNHGDYYSYFSTRSFAFNGRNYRNHNRLLGRVKGVDGIKTGYINASGFNLTTSAQRGKRHLVAVVMGGPTGAMRDARMASLLEKYFPKASTTKALKGPIPRPALISRAPVPTLRPVETAADGTATDAIAALASKPAVLMPTLKQTPQAPVLAASIALPTKFGGRVPAASSLAPTTLGAQHETLLGKTGSRAGALQPITVVYRQPGARRAVMQAATTPAPAAAAATVLVPTLKQPQPAAKATTVGTAAVAPASKAPDASVPSAKMNDTVAELITQQLQDLWLIQIGAFDEEAAAREKLRQAQDETKALKSRLAYTEVVKKDDLTLYRARFMGFDRDAAKAACDELKKAKFKCLPMKQ